MDLATLNAILNSAAAIALTTGFVFIRRKNIVAHKRAMLTAFALSCAFLTSYVIHHAQVGSVPYRGQGWSRILYFSILIPHVLLAIAVVPMALTSIYRALKGNFVKHRPIARVTLPVWLFVSVSGVVVYLMLYQL